MLSLRNIINGVSSAVPTVSDVIGVHRVILEGELKAKTPDIELDGTTDVSCANDRMRFSEHADSCVSFARTSTSAILPTLKIVSKPSPLGVFPSSVKSTHRMWPFNPMLLSEKPLKTNHGLVGPCQPRAEI